MEKSIQMPEEFCCPITTQLMEDPVIAADGITYQRKAIQEWMKENNNSPFYGNQLPHKTIIPYYAIKNAIENFQKTIPKFMAQQKMDLQQAIKTRKEKVKSFMNKFEKRSQNEENSIIKIKQLQRELLIERISHSQAQKKLLKFQNELQVIKKNCTCIKENNEIEKGQKIHSQQTQMLKNNLSYQVKNSFNIKQILKGVKKIEITPNQNGWSFKKRYVEVDQKNSNICVTNQIDATIFSNEQLPIKDEESFYFSIKAVNIKDNNQIFIGIAFPDNIINTQGSFNLVSYYLHDERLYVLSIPSSIKPQTSINSLLSLPSQLILFVNKEKKSIFIIYNNQIQVKIPLTQQMINHKNKCLAHAWIGVQSQIQFM